MSVSSAPQNIEREVLTRLRRFSRQPLQYALWNWPNADLRQWQIEWLEQIGRQLNDAPYQPIQTARASGHGIGKSAGIAILANWAVETKPLTRGVITANTDTQLRTKTWPELIKWHDTALTTRLIPGVFQVTATRLFHSQHEGRWRIDAIPWSEHNTEAFAGLHNQGNRILVAYDEASAISDKIWEVTEGALTDEETEIIWVVKGNPTRNTGRFRECFGRLSHRWDTKSIDSRTVDGTNKTQIQKWVDDYGEDSDFVRVRVRGMFPAASSMQFIETDIVEAAMRREPIAGIRDPLVMGVDVARGGDDRFVITWRRGFDGKSIPPISIPGSECRDSMRLVARVADLATTSDPLRRPDGIIVDETGVGGPIVDRLRQILGDSAQVYGVNFAAASPDPKLANMRAYMWWKLRDWLRLGGCLPSDPDLERDLCGVEYYHDKRDRVVLESKEDMKDRGLASPDLGDGYAVTFAYPIQPREVTHVRGGYGRAQTEYDHLERA